MIAPHVRRGLCAAVLLLGAAVADAGDPPAGGLRVEVGRACARLREAVRTWKAAGANGDELLSACLRAAVGTDEPSADGARAALIALALTVDSSNLYRRNPLGGAPYADVADAAFGGDLADVRDAPTILGRHDWAQHFAVSAALAAQLSPELSIRAGYAKEVSDARERETGPASGFSFADLEADYAGIELARRLVRAGAEAHAIRDRLRAGATIGDFVPDLREMPEELTYTQFVEQYGGPRDPRYRTMVERIRRRIADCGAYRAPAGDAGKAD